MLSNAAGIMILLAVVHLLLQIEAADHTFSEDAINGAQADSQNEFAVEVNMVDCERLLPTQILPTTLA